MIFSKGAAAYFLPHLWEKGVCRIFGIKVRVVGDTHRAGQTIFAANHISYLDIPVLGGIIRGASFVAKADVAGWPVFGFLARLQQTAFISRAREDARRETNALRTMLEAGKSLIIFPEGTSTDGREVLAFKSSMFSIALIENRAVPLYIQPITLQVIESDGRVPETQDQRDIYAWHRDMDTELPTHLWGFAKARGAIIELVFHDPILVAGDMDRKTLAKACHDAVSNGLTARAA
ncbi:MAG: 1-acyl-sn-glycerol-3-phosphate acyltransferase [Alphaproteobacteria bacterium]|nr:1-acyl-sn-glycerol-3-phosphate acyltransferase [Alphaproteobacteria bacterium]